MSPIGWALRPLKRYAEFFGRSSRAEFWWFFPFLILVFLATWLGMLVALGITVSPGAGPDVPTDAGPSGTMDVALGAGVIFLGLFWVALIIPSVALQTRRLHDTNRSGWWIGAFYLLYAAYMILVLGAAIARASAPTPPNSLLSDAAVVLWLVMFLYSIVLLVLFCQPGTNGHNRFGDDPYGVNIEEVFA